MAHGPVLPRVRALVFYPSSNVLLKGLLLKIEHANRTPRETLEKRLEETPSNARCFAQGSSSMCWPILESLMGTTHGAEELGLCPHGLAYQAGAWGHYIHDRVNA
jgi:hypothetical protein